MLNNEIKKIILVVIRLEERNVREEKTCSKLENLDLYYVITKNCQIVRGRSSLVEQWIAVPSVIGSIPVSP